VHKPGRGVLSSSEPGVVDSCIEVQLRGDLDTSTAAMATWIYGRSDEVMKDVLARAL
jgi:uncharacterized protein YqgV (UPF0045/DUF77 family)